MKKLWTSFECFTDFLIALLWFVISTFFVAATVVISLAFAYMVEIVIVLVITHFALKYW